MSGENVSKGWESFGAFAILSHLEGVSSPFIRLTKNDNYLSSCTDETANYSQQTLSWFANNLWCCSLTCNASNIFWAWLIYNKSKNRQFWAYLSKRISINCSLTVNQIYSIRTYESNNRYENFDTSSVKWTVFQTLWKNTCTNT